MKKLLIVLACGISLMANDIIIKESSCSVTKTIQNIKTILGKKGLRVFKVVNHQKNAKSVNMKMRESKLIVFGNPKLGTSLMKKDMTVGLDLPMKILVYKDKDEKVRMAYRNGTWLAGVHALSIPAREKKINGAMDKITTKAGTCTQG
ncbi:DUF302 domain-containing protein [Sulfurimonas sp. SAG-AH-194-I05]|nr:DUF302 domain-containing protein [Sulfurimonas sp. SAG-AH-194-I05]MDF1874222.1 DUF302 domain-containing protein [Sulfurimonas sp. SAG-AH-194-I05]